MHAYQRRTRPTNIDTHRSFVARPGGIKRCYDCPGGPEGGGGGGNTSTTDALGFFMDRWEGWPRRQKDGGSGRGRGRGGIFQTKAFLLGECRK